MKALGQNWGACAAFLLVAGGVSLLTALAAMPERGANGRSVAGWTGLADADSRPNDPPVFAFEMTDSLASPDRSLAVAGPRPDSGPDPAPLSKEKREIAEHLASIGPAMGAPALGASAAGQTGTVRRMASARVLLGRHRAWRPDVLVAEVEGRRHYRVVLGPFSEADAKQVRRRMAEHGIEDAWILTPAKDADLTLRNPRARAGSLSGARRGEALPIRRSGNPSSPQ